MADGFQLLQNVRPGQQVPASLEQLALEIGPQPEAQDRDIEPVHDFRRRTVVAQVVFGISNVERRVGKSVEDSIPAGVYMFTLTDDNGCTLEDSIGVFEADYFELKRGE